MKYNNPKKPKIQRRQSNRLSLIKNIVFNFKKYGSIRHFTPKKKFPDQTRKTGEKKYRKHDSGFI